MYSQRRGIWCSEKSNHRSSRDYFWDTFDLKKHVFIDLRKQIDKKWRVSVPASFRSYLSSMGYNGVICYPSFNNPSIEGCSQNRIEKLSRINRFFKSI